VLNGGTCNPIGYLVLAVAATDDATHPDRIGYRVQVTAGDAVRSPNEDLVATDSSLYLYFDPRSPGFVIDLEVSAVDQNGNVGPATAYHVDFTNPNPVTDEPEPTDDGGCATSGGAGWLAALAVALLVLRRRRR
jgi:uncharacterized protein (TIGR03382 family)